MSTAFTFDAPPAYLPVPLGLLPDMVRHLSELMDGIGESVATLSPPLISPAIPSTMAPPEWSEDELRRLLPLLFPQNEVALAVLDMTAAKPGELISFPDACQSTVNKKDVRQGKSGMGALTKVCRKIGKDKWPVTWHWAEGGENVAYYRMTPEIARLWQKVRSLKP